MGQVWSAVHVVTGRRVALKRLLLAGVSDDDERADSQAHARFLLEAQTACAVEHPNVVEVLDFVEPGDEPPLLVMELLDGETLAAKLDRESVLSLEDTVNIVLPVVSAVGTAHSLGIIHRDLKPANIFLQQRAGQDRVVKVLDFGIAKWLAPQPSGSGLRTQTGSTLGTPCYMAPEQAIGERLVDHTADIWSLGIILYECLSGARPVDGENPVQMVVRLLNTGIMPIERVVPGLPEDMAQLAGQMLARDVAQRPVDLRAVFDVLKKYASVSAPTFAGPSQAVNHDSVQAARTPAGFSTFASFRERNAAESRRERTTPSPSDGLGSLLEGPRAIDAHAATLRDESNQSGRAPSWQGQSVSAKARANAKSSRQIVGLVFAAPAALLLAYFLARTSGAPEAKRGPVPATTPASAALPAAVKAPATTTAQTPSALNAPTATATVTAATTLAATAAAEATPARSKARVTRALSRSAPTKPEDEDGTSDRK
jgi:eukaryotic-like serine/threonine-protein kinase